MTAFLSELQACTAPDPLNLAPADYRALSRRRPPVLAEERRARMTSVSPASERGRSRQPVRRSGAIALS